MSAQAFTVPIRLELGVVKKKMYYLNLNKYRNWQFHVNNQLKKSFKIEVISRLRQLHPVEPPCKLTYTIYYPTKREFDIDNIGSIVGKFTHDALIEAGIIEDDNYKCVAHINYVFGGIDKDNPRCEVVIEEIKNE